jgi:serine-type D-Ala-D-Ala carboxypeptidase/endopeptidase (penicillin-binding protein 4)
MTSPNVQGWVRAKTGMLNGVIGLAGFAGRKSGQILTFVFIYNGSADTYKVRDFFDNLSEALVL